jgi:hypothetical protein
MTAIACGDDDRDWTTTGVRLGVPQRLDGEGCILAAWPPEVVKYHRVYFVQAGDPDDRGLALVKIGFTTDIEQRIRQLQTASPHPLKVLAKVIGTPKIESFFHAVLRSSHVRGEWFRLHPDDIHHALIRLWEEGLAWSW